MPTSSFPWKILDGYNEIQYYSMNAYYTLTLFPWLPSPSVELQLVWCSLAFRWGHRPAAWKVERKCKEAEFAAQVLLHLHSHRNCSRTGNSEKQIFVFLREQSICVQTGCKVDPGLLDSLFGLILKQTEMRGFLAAWCISFLGILLFFTFFICLSCSCQKSGVCLKMKLTLDKEHFVLLMLPFTWLGQGEPRKAVFWVPLRNVRLE